MPTYSNAPALAAITFNEDTRITSFSFGAGDITGCDGSGAVGERVTQILADETVFELPLILKTAKERGRWEGEMSCIDGSNTPFQADGVVLYQVEKETRKAVFLMLIRPCGDAGNTGNSNSLYWEIGSKVREHIHDLNNSLAIIMGSAQLLTISSGCTEKVQSDIKKIYEELERVASVIGTLHEYAFSLCDKATTSDPEEDAFHQNV